MATHDFEHADGLVDRMVCLRDGRAREIGGTRARARSVSCGDGGGVDVNVLRVAWVIARKDLVVEMRSRELAYTTLFFAVACVLVFAFAFIRQGRALRRTPPPASSGSSLAFSGTLALGRAFERERQEETLRALLLAPVERASIYLGKLAGLLVLMAGGRA